MVALYIYFFILGLIIGSFLNVCIYRIPAGQSIITPPSNCQQCHMRLKPIDLVPVFSYIFLRGKCRYCGTRISPRYMLIELLTGSVFAVLFYRYGVEVEFLAAAFIMSILIAVFFIDIDERIIPDGLVITGLAGGAILFVYNIFTDVKLFMDNTWWNPLAGVVSGFGALFLVALIGMLVYKSDDAMGMGDVKIFAPIGLFLGWQLTLLALVLAIFMAGFSGVLLIITRLKGKKDTIPFGPYIVTAVFICLMWGKDIINWYIGGM